MIFFLGADSPRWLARAAVPLFVSARQLRGRRRLPRAGAPWALDSGGFTELSLHGRWQTAPRQYAREARLWRGEVGNLAWCAPQDWMCEPQTLLRTGLSVEQHQERTLASYLTLCSLAPDLPWIPVLQGWAEADYLRHADAYHAAGVDLARLPLVGLGSVCRRQDTRGAELIVRRLACEGIRLHLFGFKLKGLLRCARWAASSDSMAWAQDARRDAARVHVGEERRHPCPAGKHDEETRSGCTHCLPYALAWRGRALGRIERGRHYAHQGELFGEGGQP